MPTDRTPEEEEILEILKEEVQEEWQKENPGGRQVELDYDPETGEVKEK